MKPRHALLLLVVVLAAGALVRYVVGARAREPAPAPSASPSSIPVALCPGNARSDELFDVVKAALAARVAEARELVAGLRPTVIGEERIETIGRHPVCALSEAAVIHDRVERARETFFARKDTRPHRDSPSVSVRVGCEGADGTLLVSLYLGIAIGEMVAATYAVDARTAKLVVGGFAIAHADLDGDGIRDVVWQAADRRINVQLSASHRALKTSMRIPENEDSDGSFAAVPALDSTFAVLMVDHTEAGSLSIRERLEWNGKELAPVARLTDTGFEDRFAAARQRVLALEDDPITGGLGKVRWDLLTCAQGKAVTLPCTTTLDTAAVAMTEGGIPDAPARALLRGYFGWRPCPAPPGP